MTLKNLGYAAVFGATAFSLVLGSASVGQAKEMMMAEPMSILCHMVHAPVCAVKGGLKFTYNNSCFALRDHAKIVSKGACKPHKMMSKMKKMDKKPMKKM